MTRREVIGYAMIALGLILWLLASEVSPAGEVSSTDINPLADTMGWILAVPVARLLGAGFGILACLSFAKGHGGYGLLFIMLTGFTLVGPVIIKTVISTATG